MKKSPTNRFSRPRAGDRSSIRSWHNGADAEIHLYARSLHEAAKVLVGKLDPNTRTDWDACPVVLLYREALELHLKALVGEGSHLLKSRTDPISLSQTHSLRWLAQIAGQIIKTVAWEDDFTCDGVACLADFRSLIDEVESLSPVTRATRSPRANDPDSLSRFYRSFEVMRFAKRMDGLLSLLDVTADALAATYNGQTAPAEFNGGYNPTIQ